MTLTVPDVVACMPACPDPILWTSALHAAMSRYDIDTPERAAAFIAQIAHESADCTRLVESLDYSAPRLAIVWPSRFPTIESARPYAHSPERLANVVYARRLGNGDVASGDGWRFRGRGLIQLTGRANYQQSGLAIGLNLTADPDVVATPQVAALTAAQFWHSRGLNALADNRADDDDIDDFARITTIINGGRQGFDDRLRRWARAKSAFVA